MKRSEVDGLVVGDLVRTTSFGKLFVVSGFDGDEVKLNCVSERGTVMKHYTRVSRFSLVDNGFKLVADPDGVVL